MPTNNEFRLKNELGYYYFQQAEKLFGTATPGLYENKKSFLRATELNQSTAFHKDIPLPDLLKPTIGEHLDHIGTLVKGKQIKAIDDFCEAPLSFTDEQVEQAIQDFELFGYEWCKYDFTTGEWVAIDALPPGVKVYDVETYVKGGAYPILGVALDNQYLYIWSPEKFDPQGRLIPVGEKQILIGHNVGYDLGRTLEPYTLGENSVDWVDTQSMHIVCNGLAGGQRAYFALNESLKKGKYLDRDQYRYAKSYQPWSKQGTTNSLAAAYKFHVGGEMEKELRNVFVVGTLEEIKDGIIDKSLLRYAVLDVVCTARLAKVLWRKLRFHKPSNVSLAGLMLRMKGRIPLDPNWKQWYLGCDAKYKELEQEVGLAVRKEANRLYELFKGNPDFWKDDFWYMQLDWSVKPKARGKYKGVPEWYRPFVKDPNYTPSSRNVLTHHLMKMTWEGSPLLHDKKKKWCYEDKKGKLVKVPHNKTPGANVGILLCNDYKWALDLGVLESEGGELAQRLFSISKSLSYWTSIQSRVKAKFVVHEGDTPITVGEPLPWGTVSGRVSESLFLTLCSTKKDKIGTELKTRFQAPPGWSVVGFDYDQQEVRIASLLADFQNGGILGSTPISKQVYTGNKADGTGSHSVLASKLNVSRDNAKPLNFLMQYNGGKKSLADKLKQNNKSWSDAKCQGVAELALKVHKGTKCYTQDGKPFYKDGIASQMFNYMEEAVNKPVPQLPFLGTRLSRALWTKYCGRDFMTGRTNWLIQASGSEILDATLVCVKYLSDAYNVDCRFIISIHDRP